MDSSSYLAAYWDVSNVWSWTISEYCSCRYRSRSRDEIDQWIIFSFFVPHPQYHDVSAPSIAQIFYGSGPLKKSERHFVALMVRSLFISSIYSIYIVSFAGCCSPFLCIRWCLSLSLASDIFFLVTTPLSHTPWQRSLLFSSLGNISLSLSSSSSSLWWPTDEKKGLVSFYSLLYRSDVWLKRAIGKHVNTLLPIYSLSRRIPLSRCTITASERWIFREEITDSFLTSLLHPYHVSFYPLARWSVTNTQSNISSGRLNESTREGRG